MAIFSESADSDPEINLSSLFSALWQKKGWIILWSLVGLGLAFAFLLMVDPVYRTDARLLIERRESVFTRPNDERNGPVRADFDTLFIASQVEVLQSSNLLKSVATKLKLASREEFDPLLSGSNVGNPLSNLLTLIGFKSDNLADTREGRVLSSFRDRLSVYPVNDSRVISVEMTTRDPQLTAEIANAIGAEYLLIQREDSRVDTAGASKFLEGEISDLRNRVAVAERKVEDFRSGADLFVVDDESTLTRQQLSETLTLLSDVSAQRAEAEAKADQIRRLINSGAALDSSSNVQGSPLIQRLREQQVNLRARIVDLQTSLLPNHPQVQAARSQLRDLESEIGRQALLIARALEGDSEVAKVRQRELEQEIARLKTASARANEQEIKLRAFEREARAQRELLETYLTRFRESTARQNAELLPVNARVISRASAPIEKHFPKTVPTFFVSGFAGAFLASLFIMVSELMSGRVIVSRVIPQAGSSPANADLAIVVPDSVSEGSGMTPDTGSVNVRPEPVLEEKGQMTHQSAPDVVRKTVDTDGVPDDRHNDVPQSLHTPKAGDESASRLLRRVAEKVRESDVMPLPASSPSVATNFVNDLQRDGGETETTQPGRHPVSPQESELRTGIPQKTQGIDKKPDQRQVSATDLYSLHDALAAIDRYQLEHVVVLPVFRDISCADLALELSRLLADTGRSVVFVDTTNADFGNDIPLPGLSDVMDGSAALNEAIFADPMSSVDLMASGTFELEEADWNEGHTQEILDTLAGNYNMVVIHDGQGTGVSYIHELIDRSDMLLFAVSAPISRQQVADILREKIGEVPAHSMFVAFNEEDDIAA